MLDDGTNWTAPGLELEFRARLETLIVNGFKQEVQLAGCSVSESAESPTGRATSSEGAHDESASSEEAWVKLPFTGLAYLDFLRFQLQAYPSISGLRLRIN